MLDRMPRWFTADLHLGHANIIEYCRRPFADVDAMNRALVDRWNGVVADGDEVWVLGDVALGTIAETLPLVAALAGRKVLVTGNHDRCWRGHGRRAEGWDRRYREAGFDEIVHGETRIEVGGHDTVACHFPYRGDSHDRDRFVDSRPVDRGRWLLHGHIHDRWRQRGRMVNVGVDAWDYRPASETEVAGLIDAGPADVGAPAGATAAATAAAIDQLARPWTIASVGYEGRGLEEVLEALVAAEVDVVVDVRLNALSRKPGFSKGALSTACAVRGITYLHEPTLGNPATNRDGFRAGHVPSRARYRARLLDEGRDALARVAALRRDRTIALLCFEADQATCHRSTVADELARLDPPASVRAV